MSDFVPENAIDYDEVFRRGGRNLGDEDFALFKCPSCGRIYLLEYELDTVYLDPDDLSRRAPVSADSFDCVGCGRRVADDEPWIGNKANPKFGVTWPELEASRWSWVAPRPGLVLQAVDHVQLAIPPGGEHAARHFFADVLGMSEERKPDELAGRGGCWFRAGKVHLHCGVESPFQPQKKAHPAFLVAGLEALARSIESAGGPVLWDDAVPGRRRFYTEDPFGNRLEFVAAGCGFSERLQPLAGGAGQ